MWALFYHKTHPRHPLMTPMQWLHALFHKLGCNKQPTQIYNAAILTAEIMSQGLIPWGLDPPLCSTRATIEANSWINNCIVASYFCSAHIIDICIGVIHWVNSCSSILSWGLNLLTASASVTSLPGMYLISKPYGCIVSNTLFSLGHTSCKKILSELFYRLMVWFS